MRAMTEENELEEERRLMYVGITRAKNRLFLSHAYNRMLYNSRQSNPISRFVGEIPRALLSDGRTLERPLRLTPSSPTQKYNPDKPGLINIPGVSRGFSADKQPPAHTLFKAGDRVRHRSFGYGTVTEVRTDKHIVIVDFGEAFGIKMVDANMAPMVLAE